MFGLVYNTSILKRIEQAAMELAQIANWLMAPVQQSTGQGPYFLFQEVSAEQGTGLGLVSDDGHLKEVRTMDFKSLLFPTGEGVSKEQMNLPETTKDLKLDEIIESITAGKDEYGLKPFFYTPLQDPGTIYYRQQIMTDIENEDVFACVSTFAREMRNIRNLLSLVENAAYRQQAQGWFMEAAELYCTAVIKLFRDLKVCEHDSLGLSGFVQYLADYIHSAAFQRLSAESQHVRTALSEIQYSILIKGQSVTVQKCDSRADYSGEVQETFERFRRGASEDYRVKFSDWIEMNHVDAQILHLVSKLFKEAFSELERFYQDHQNFIDKAVQTFDREIQFYVAYHEYIAPLKQRGLLFCLPKVCEDSKEISAEETFDIALAQNLMRNNQLVVRNDFYLRDRERIFVVSGPNQGGKTTFARTFGQVHFLAALGLAVPGRTATTFLFDEVFTHFEREEQVTSLDGKLKDDLLRIHQILSRATSKSIIILNEIFSSTALMDAIFLGKEIVREIIKLDSLGLIVTFVDELASFSDETVSMVSTVYPDNPDIRTYEVRRQQADGRAYATSIARKYGLTYEALKERLIR